MFKKIIMSFAMVFYLYTLTFDIFMTDFLRLPAPALFVLIALPFVKTPLLPFDYYLECVLVSLAIFFYYIVGIGDITGFFATLIIILSCAFYFLYFVGSNKRRFNLSVLIFFLLLLFSMVIMVLDHSYGSIIEPLRSALLDENVKQSPSGIADTQFNFGYQVAAFTGLAFALAFTFRQHLLVKVLVFGVCMTFIYLGMNRSAFVAFIVAAVLFLFFYYRFAGVLIITGSIIIGFAVYTFVLKDNMDEKNNILAKNTAKEDIEINRADMASENLKIYADYPFGLIFYGKNWEDVTYRNPVFPFGLTSHNAYLMFVTYLGPFLGIGLLIAFYRKIVRFFWLSIKHVRLKPNALLVGMFFSFIAVSVNAFFHNNWLLAGDGPTLFLYFGILQGSKIYLAKDIIGETQTLATTH